MISDLEGVTVSQGLHVSILNLTESCYKTRRKASKTSSVKQHNKHRSKDMLINVTTGDENMHK